MHIFSLIFIAYIKILLTLVMGRGDKKTKRGKISKGSFGKSRPARPVKKKAAKAAEPRA
jgi:30S ribosomal protein S31